MRYPLYRFQISGITLLSYPFSFPLCFFLFPLIFFLLLPFPTLFFFHFYLFLFFILDSFSKEMVEEASGIGGNRSTSLPANRQRVEFSARLPYPLSGGTERKGTVHRKTVKRPRHGVIKVKWIPTFFLFFSFFYGWLMVSRRFTFQIVLKLPHRPRNPCTREDLAIPLDFYDSPPRDGKKNDANSGNSPLSFMLYSPLIISQRN